MRMTKTINCILCIIAFALFTIIWEETAYAAEGVNVHMINVGNGDSFLVEYNDHYALIDGGYASHYAKTKDEKTNSTISRLDKTAALSDALEGRVSDLAAFYNRNLFSFFEHFDNDMKMLTKQTGTAGIMTAVTDFFNAFDGAVKEREEQDSESDETLTDAEWNVYQRYRDVFDGIRGGIDASYNEDPTLLRAFMELQRDDSIIRSEDKNSLLYKYYTALGYQYIYAQIDGYLQQSKYIDNGFNDCLSYLKKLGVVKIDYMVVTHGHKDHVGGLSAVLASDQIEVKNIIYNGTSYGTATFRVFEHEMLDRQAAEKSDVIIADDNNNNQFVLGGEVVFTELGDTDRLAEYTREPDQTSDSDKDLMNHVVNNQSLVYRMDYQNASMLFAGDAEWKQDASGYNEQATILSKYRAKLNVDIYKAAHHCHNNGSNIDFNNAVSPGFVLASCGLSNEPHVKAINNLAGADIWASKGKGSAVTVSLTRHSLKVRDGSGKDITYKPDYKHTPNYKITSNYGTPHAGKASFAAGGRTVSAFRAITTKTEYYNRPTTRSIKVSALPGWYYDTVQCRSCVTGKDHLSTGWLNRSAIDLQPGFKGTVQFRFTNKFAVGTSEGKTDGFDIRTERSRIHIGRAVLNKYNRAVVDWYPVKGAGSYKVWIKRGHKWIYKGKTKALYKVVSNLPQGKVIKFRIKAVGKKGYAYAYVRTLRKTARPAVKRKGSRLTIKWKKVTGSAGYQVSVNSAIKATVKGRSAKLTISKRKKRIYRVRAFKKSNGITIYAPWSYARIAY